MNEHKKGFVGAHDQVEHITITEHVGGHDERVETPVFREAKRHLHEEGFPCFICFAQNWRRLVDSGALPRPTEADLMLNGRRLPRLVWYYRECGRRKLLTEPMTIPGAAEPDDRTIRLEIHHRPLERCHATQADFELVDLFCEAFDLTGLYAELADHPPVSDPDDPRNQLPLCILHHNHTQGTSVHCSNEVVWLAQGQMKPGEVAVEPPEGYHPQHKEGA